MIDESSSETSARREHFGHAATVLLAAGALLLSASWTSAAEPGSESIREMIEAAKEQGVRVVVIEPQSATTAEAAASGAIGGHALAAFAGRVARQVETLRSDISAPGWPKPSADPGAPLLSWVLVLLGVALGLAATRKAGLSLHPRYGQISASEADDRTARPARIGLGIAGIGLVAFSGTIPPLAIQGAEPRTVDLLGGVLDVYLKCALVDLFVAALLERLSDRGAPPGVEPDRIARGVRLALVLLFLLIGASIVTVHAWPDRSLAKLAGLFVTTLAAMFAIVLAVRYRSEISILALRASGRRVRLVSRSLWILACAYVSIAWIIACVRVLLERPDPSAIVLAPVFGLLAGVAVYHASRLLGQKLLSRWRPDEDAGEEPKADEHWLEDIARALGLVAGVAVMLERIGVNFVRPDGTASFLPLAAAVLLLAFIAWTVLRVAIDRRLAAETVHVSTFSTDEGDPAQRSRLVTLLPLVRKTALAAIIFVTALVLLEQAGVDVTPIFASAGIVGLAIGFGAQSLVRDIISGLFFLLDDAFRIGEYIETGGAKGTVERISIRSMQLRHQNGPLNTLPFGSITELTNYSRDWVIMKLPIKVTLDTDPERVRKLVKTLGESLKEDPQIGGKFLEPLKSQGVLSIDNSGITMRVKFKTRPGDQFLVRRIVYARLHEMFEREGIEFASRNVRVVLGGDAAEGGAGAPASPAHAAALTGAASLLAEEEAAPSSNRENRRDR